MKKTFVLITSVFLLFFFSTEKLSAQTAFVDGNLMNSQGQPIPGVTVSLVHQFIGRSTPSITNVFGYFYFPNVPINYQVPYFLEIYWGNQLVFREVLPVNQPFVKLGWFVVQ